MSTQESNYRTRFEECDDKFNTIFDLTSAASKIINADLTILKVNKAVTELLGFSAEEIEGTKILDYACPEYIKHWHELQEALWSKQLPFFKLEACLIRKDKSIAWVNVTTILFNDQGETYGFTVFDDITYRKEFEESEKKLRAALEQSNKIGDELRKKQQDLTRVLETMAEGVGIIDTTGKMTYANPMAQRILGLSAEEITQRTYHDLEWQNLRLDGTPLPPEEHPMAIMMATQKLIVDHEIAVQPPTGDRFYVSINAAPILDDDGTLLGGIGTFMDVTNRRKIIQQKDEFISVASHELKTPVTSLKASLQLLSKMQDNPSPKMLPVLVQQANRSLNKVSTLIADLLNASKLNEGQLQLNKTMFNLAQLINDCCDHIRITSEYTIHTEGDTQLQVNADADRIDQVITNFVNNAVKYAPETKEIRVLIEKQENFARVSVIDKGKGIPPEKQAYLFERYFRVDTSGLQYSGLGLGLYINAEIIKKHGGNYGVESTLGQGSTFWFTLPL